MSSDSDLFTRLGGTRAVADMIGEPPSTVQSWKVAKRIPSTKQPLVIEKVRAAGHLITASDVVFPFGVPGDLVSRSAHCPSCDRRASGEVAACVEVLCPCREKEAA